MKRIALIAAMTLAAAPAFANYGDVDAQISVFKTNAVFVAQPQVDPSNTIAAAEACTLPFTHIVSIPDSFTDVAGVEVACLDN